MIFFLPRIVQMNLIILLVFVAITNIDCRPGGGRGKVGRMRGLKLMKNKLNTNRHLSYVSKTNHHLVVSGGAVGLLVGTLALRSFVSTKNKASIQSRHLLTNGTGSLCINRENYSNFIFNEFRCPLSPVFTANNRYCCGSFQQQYCCSFWESGGRAIGAIVGIISVCCLCFLFIICCIVYYRRYLQRKDINNQINTIQPPIAKRLDNSILSDSPPPYSEAIRCLTET